MRFGKELVRYETDGRNVTAFFADGTEASGRVLVGAEGGRSRVRAQLLPHAERIDTGVVSIGGRLPLTAERPGAAARTGCGRGPVMVLAPGGINMFLALHEQDEPDGGGPAARAHAAARPRRLPGVGAHRTAPGAGSAPRTTRERGAAPYRLALAATRSWDDRLQRLVAMTDPATVTTLTIRTARRGEAVADDQRHRDRRRDPQHAAVPRRRRQHRPPRREPARPQPRRRLAGPATCCRPSPTTSGGCAGTASPRCGRR